MTFEEKFNLNPYMPHNELYTAIVDHLGFENVKKYIPFSREEIIKALETDNHLNNLSIQKWDDAAGYTVYIDQRTKRQVVKLRPAIYSTRIHTTLPALCISKGVTTFCLAELVCVLKHCAVMWAEMSEHEIITHRKDK